MMRRWIGSCVGILAAAAAYFMCRPQWRLSTGFHDEHIRSEGRP